MSEKELRDLLTNYGEESETGFVKYYQIYPSELEELGKQIENLLHTKQKEREKEIIKAMKWRQNMNALIFPETGLTSTEKAKIKSTEIGYKLAVDALEEFLTKGPSDGERLSKYLSESEGGDESI